MKMTGQESFQSPAERVAMIRHRIAIILKAAPRHKVGSAFEKLALENTMQHEVADIFEDLAWLEAEGHLKEFQELLMAEGAGTP